MQFTQTSTFSLSPIASGSSNDWTARPTQAAVNNDNAIPAFWPFGPAALAASHPYPTNGYDFPGPKSNEAEPAHRPIPGPRADENGKMSPLDDLAFLDYPHTPPAPADPFPAAGSVLKLCARCLSGCTAEDGPKACPVPHAPPILAWITSGRVNYPVHYYPCCDTYRLAIPGLRLRRPFNPVCRWGPHIPAD